MAATPQSPAAPKPAGELNKPLLIVWGVILAAPILLRLGTLFSSQLNLWFVQMNQKIPLFDTLMIAVPLLGGAATFAYIQFVLKKKK